MPPLYQHFNKQKVVTPQQSLATNYTLYTAGAYGSYSTLVQNGGSGLRCYYNNNVNAPQYANNGYFVNNTPLVSGAQKTITAKMSWNTINHGGWAGLCFRDSSNQFTRGIWSIPYPGFGWRYIGFAAPGGSYNTSWGDSSRTFTVGEMFWLQVTDDPSTGNFILRYSLNGSGFTTYAYMPRLATVDQWCICIVPSYNSTNGSTDFNIHEITIT